MSFCNFWKQISTLLFSTLSDHTVHYILQGGGGRGVCLSVDAHAPMSVTRPQERLLCLPLVPFGILGAAVLTLNSFLPPPPLPVDVR